MAIAAPPLTRSKGLLELLQQTMPLQEQAVELYRRLLAIHDLAASMNGAGDMGELQEVLTTTFAEWMARESVRLCIADGSCYRRIRLSGPDIPSEEGIFPLDDGIVGKVLKTGTPLHLPDTYSFRISSVPTAVAVESLPRSVMVLPFAALGKTVGALEMVSSQPNRFDDIDYHLAFLVAAHLSSSLENILAREELAAANALLRDRDLKMMELNERLQQLAHTDDATGLFNKRRLLEQLNAEVARARRHGEILSCLMIDIDDFKQINDSLGHQAGDEVLRQFGRLLRCSLRVTDFVARYGGEEFTVLLPRTDRSGALRVTEKLRAKLRSHPFELSGVQARLTVSIGIACCTKFDRLDAQQVILLADNALYGAKRLGKDRAFFADECDDEQGAVKISSMS